MTQDYLTIIRYLVSGEESRTGRMDYWNNYFLESRTPLHRMCLELSKVFFLLGLSTCIAMAIALV